MIDHHHENLSVRSQCDLLSVNRSTLYYKPHCMGDDTELANKIPTAGVCYLELM